MMLHVSEQVGHQFALLLLFKLVEAEARLSLVHSLRIPSSMHVSVPLQRS